MYSTASSARLLPGSTPTTLRDCFCATFVTLTAAGLPLAEALAQANAAGALAVGSLGPMEGNSTLAEIAAVLNPEGA